MAVADVGSHRSKLGFEKMSVEVREDHQGGIRRSVARGMGKEAEEAGREPEVQTTSATGRKEWTGRVDDEMGVHFSRA
jgi:hypothetical protein